MKSVEELNAIREKAREGMGIRNDKHQGARVVVSMGTCGIAAGARQVLAALVEEVAKEKLDVQVSQTGCRGDCKLEPMLEVLVPGRDKVMYVSMNPDKVKEVVRGHLAGGEILSAYTAGAPE